MSQTLSDLPSGHTFETVRFSVDAAKSRAYREATGDTNPVFESEGFVPPLCVAALALGALLNQVGLPPGTLHTNESLEFLAAVPVDTELQCTARIAQKSQRAGMIVTVIENELLLDGTTAIKARATVFSPGAATPS